MHSFNRVLVVSASFLLVLLAAIAASAQGFKTLYAFNESSTSGASPHSLVQGRNGYLYGTAAGGGTHGYGVVFSISPGGAYTTLYSFCSQSGCTDGEYPEAALVQASNGKFYGTTLGGGAYGDGTVFEMTPSGTLTTLHSFDSTDGNAPESNLVQASDGNLYGTTSAGGVSDACGPLAGCGTVFRITLGGALTTLYSFCSQSGCADGADPSSGLFQAADGSLWGTTIVGGANTSCKLGDDNGCGTVFRITLSGTLTTSHNFCSQSGCTDGEFPVGGVVQASNGYFYGATFGGGANASCDGGLGCGTIYEISPSGVLTTAYSFCSQSDCVDGEEPEAGLVQATDGNLYGTTVAGGTSRGCNDNYDGCGTLFTMAPSGALTTLYSFCSQSACTDGDYPADALVQDTNGRLYGVTNEGGNYHRCEFNGCGTVFALNVGLSSFVETQPTFGKMGKPVNILGTSLNGATSVTFNGTAATFTVVSPSLIRTTVPAGATTGPVQVVTPGGALKSNVPFRVIQ